MKSLRLLGMLTLIGLSFASCKKEVVEPTLENKIIEIGSFDLKSDISKVIDHNVLDIKKIKSISVIIYDDLENRNSYSLESGGVYILNDKSITIARNNSEVFYNDGFDDLSVNRGIILIQLTE
jgi:hypothetical protein